MQPLKHPAYPLQALCQLPYRNHETSTKLMDAKDQLLSKLICLHLRSMPPLAVLLHFLYKSSQWYRASSEHQIPEDHSRHHPGLEIDLRPTLYGSIVIEWDPDIVPPDILDHGISMTENPLLCHSCKGGWQVGGDLEKFRGQWSRAVLWVVDPPHSCKEARVALWPRAPWNCLEFHPEQ